MSSAPQESQETTCKLHPTAGWFDTTDYGKGCVACHAKVQALADEAMRDGSADARVAALKELCEVGWYLSLRPVWEQVDKVVGRGVMTHELAFPDALEAEIRSGEQPTDVEIVMKLKNAMGDKPVVVINPEDGKGYTV